ncbi:MAG: o-succinylbenzoate synthase [Proteobacteria bacterium]|nr:o-succinylbenzoate synthase [Cystobacterineae bacterium]MCL2258927.1 o-succinylbenzoate synthase [Cystobacterineae bacterium]MCL2314753.1 o-succinylbenzoate synthase [Pseudomonadota bacterium]
MKLRFEHCVLKLKTALFTSHGCFNQREGFRIFIEDEEGRHGRGEVFPMPSFGTETLPQAAQALSSLKVEHMPSTLEELEAALLGLRQLPCTRFGLEVAFLEAMAFQRACPVWQLFSKQAPPQISCYALIEGKELSSLEHSALSAVRAGFSKLKFKAGAASLEWDAHCLGRLRRSLGDSIGIRIDANGAWREMEARVFLRGVSMLHLELCEQPVPAKDVHALCRLHRLNLGIPLAADEALLDEGRVDMLLEGGAKIDAVVLKPAALGGLIPAMQLARRARQKKVSSFITTFLDGPIGRAAAAHLAFALGETQQAHGLSCPELLEGFEGDFFSPRGGKISLPRTPGLGIP